MDPIRLIVALLLTPLCLSGQNYVTSTLLTNAPLTSSTAPANIWIGNPDSVATDAAGNVYFTSVHAVFRVSPVGQLVRFAGTGRRGFSGDGAQADAAQLNDPTGVAIDGAGTVYITDSNNHRVRRVTTDGIITTVAGSGVAGNTGDKGPAVSAQLNTPVAVAIAGTGQLYILDLGNNRIRRVSPEGIITNFAGTGAVGATGDNGQAVNATFSNPTSLALNAAGDLLVADAGNNRIRRISDGIVRTLVAGDLNFPDGVRADAAGNIYISDSGNFRIVKVTPGGTVTTVAGSRSQGFSGDGAAATSAMLNYPNDVAIGPGGTLYIADSANARIRAVSPAGVISTFAGSDVQPQIFSPDAVSVAASGTVYYTDSFRNRVFSITPGGVVTVVAGDDGQLSAPLGLALDATGNLYIADSGNHAIRKVTPSGVITTVANTGIRFPTGVAVDAAGKLYIADTGERRGVALDAAGNLYVADSVNNRVQRIAPSGAVTILAAGALKSPSGVAVDKAGNVFIADTGNNAIRRVGTDGTVTVIGLTEGYAGDGGPAALSQFSRPLGLAVDSNGNVVIADSGNSAIRVLRPSAQAITLAAVADAASEAVGPVSPGKIVVLYGEGLGPATLAQFPATAASVPTLVGGTSVSFSGIPAPVIYSFTNQVAAIVPYGVSGTATQVTVSYLGQTSLPVSVPVKAASPSFFTANASGAGQAAALNVADGSLNTALTPVKTGDYIALFATGEGLTSGAMDGKFTSLPLPAPLGKVTAKVGGIPATVQYAGGVFGVVAGLMQINVLIPNGVQPGGYVPVSINVGDVESAPGVWISVAAK